MFLSAESIKSSQSLKSMRTYNSLMVRVPIEVFLERLSYDSKIQNQDDSRELTEEIIDVMQPDEQYPFIVLPIRLELERYYSSLGRKDRLEKRERGLKLNKNLETLFTGLDIPWPEQTTIPMQSYLVDLSQEQVLGIQASPLIMKVLAEVPYSMYDCK